MMGASVYPPKRPLSLLHSYEYKHKPRRLGALHGQFVIGSYPVGEFSYVDVARAYGEGMVDEHGNSRLTDYRSNTYFCPSMVSLASEEEKKEVPFITHAEANAPIGATLAPFLAMEWESLGNTSAYAHIAKGGVGIAHYFTPAMAEEYVRRIAEYNRTHGTAFPEEIPARHRMEGAAEYFFEKCRDFFADAEERFSKDALPSRCLFWLQGEADASRSAAEYGIKLDILWEKCREIGFTHFFCIRVDYFGHEGIANVMQAQEDFVRRHPDAYMLTRAASYFPYAGRDERDWFVSPPTEEYTDCRDSFYGFPNQHINEKGFSVIAKHAAENLRRVLIDGQPPIPEQENIRALLPTDKTTV